MTTSRRKTPQMHRQQQIIKRLERRFNHRTHTISNPLVQLNPYHNAPLTALILFTTSKPAHVSVTIDGENPITKTYPGYHTIHRLPIIGLYPNTKNRITVTATFHSGAYETNTIFLKTKSLPKDFLNIKLDHSLPEKMEDGLTFIVPSANYLFAIDNQAKVRWYSTLNIRQLFKPLSNGNFLVYTRSPKTQHNLILEIDLLGKIYYYYPIYAKSEIPTTAINTDVMELSNGNLLVTTHEQTENSLEDRLVELNRRTGKVINRLDYASLFPKAFQKNYVGIGSEVGDWLHNNSIWLDTQSDSIVMTARHQDLVMKHSFPDGNIDWILSSPEGWSDDYQDVLLTPKGQNFKYPAGPHAVMALPDQDGNAETLDIMLFDNNNRITRGDEKVSQQYSRAVQYRINEKEKTVEEVWTYGEERGQAFFSPIVGDADLLPQTNNRLVTSGFIKKGNGRASKIVEVAGDSPQEEVFEVTISGFAPDSKQHIYRAGRMEI